MIFIYSLYILYIIIERGEDITEIRTQEYTQIGGLL